MAKRLVVNHKVIGTLALVSLAGCNSLNSIIEPNKIDYRSASKANTASLEVPPDLTQIRRDSRFAIPEANKSTATASGYNLEKSNKVLSNSGIVAPNQLQSMRIERSGSERWLVVKGTPEVLWPRIKDFWQELGFLINIENQETGVMETDWAENRAKIPQDMIRNTLGKVFDSLYSTGERDKFRTRLERGSNGEVEIYISHRGAQEVLTGSQKESTVWTTRPVDPGLEAEFLSRLMVNLGADADTAKNTVAATTAAKPATTQAAAKLLKEGDNSYLEVNEGFDRAWRRIGLALDRIGFTVEDRDRSQGIYFVRYVDQDVDAKSKSGQGFFARLFSWGSSDAAKDAQKYRIFVKPSKSGELSHVTVHNNEGKVDSSAAAQKMLQLLNDQLK